MVLTIVKWRRLEYVYLNSRAAAAINEAGINNTYKIDVSKPRASSAITHIRCEQKVRQFREFVEVGGVGFRFQRSDHRSVQYGIEKESVNKSCQSRDDNQPSTRRREDRISKQGTMTHKRF